MYLFDVGADSSQVGSQKKTLSERIPQMDPSLLVHRFCNKLGFGDKELPIVGTALKLLQSFKRDWMTQGRNPAGLCGAAIHIAARLHGVDCGISKITAAVRVCRDTVRKRVSEFRATPAAGLTAGEFAEIDLDAVPMDPPSLKDSEIKAIAGSEREIEAAAKRIDQELAEFSAPNEEDEKNGNIPGTEKTLTLLAKNESVSSLDESEAALYMMSSKSIDAKTALFERENADWLASQQQRTSSEKVSQAKAKKRQVVTELATQKRKKTGLRAM